jgi:hypothetical protein
VRIPKNKWLSLSLHVIAVLLIGYQVINYTGMYRWASELQTGVMGFYLPYVSAIPMLILFFPGFMTEPPLDPAIEEARLAEENSFATHEEWMIHKHQQTIDSMRRGLPRVVIVGLAATLVAFLMPAPAPPPPIRIDLATLGGTAPPVGVPVILVGTPDLAHVMTLSRHGSRVNEDVSTVPVVGPGFDGRYRFFAHLGNQDARSREVLAEIDRTGTLTGTLGENGLDGETRAAFERDGLQLATPHYLLSDRPPLTAQHWVRVAAALLGIAALFMVVALLFALWFRRKFRRQFAEYYG